MVNLFKPLVLPMTRMTCAHCAYHNAPKPLTRIPPRVLESIPIPKTNHSYHTAEASWKWPVNLLTLAGCAILTYLTAQVFNLLSTAQAAEKSAEEIEAEALAEKSGELGKCIGRTPDEFGGYIDHYELREGLKVDSSAMEAFKELGYRCDNGKVSVPDDVALKARLMKLAEKYPDLELESDITSCYSGELENPLSTYMNARVIIPAGYKRSHKGLITWEYGSFSALIIHYKLTKKYLVEAYRISPEEGRALSEKFCKTT